MRYTRRIKCRQTENAPLIPSLTTGNKNRQWNAMQPLLLVSYGAPERQDEVVPFLNNLFAGKNVPAERIASAVQKYKRFAAKTGHYSPLNTECRKLIKGIRQECCPHPNPLPAGEGTIGTSLPMGEKTRIYWGNLFWHPFLADTIAEMAKDGIERAACFATSAFDSPSGNQRYADALESARRAVGTNAPILEKLPLPFDHPLFIEAQADSLPPVSAVVCRLPSAVLLFSAHSIPLADAAQSKYVEQLQSVCRSVIEKSGMTMPWELVYQSRSGQAEHWLGPDIKERIITLATEGHVESVIVSPIGFFCENMETEYDLDVEAGELCAKLGLNYHRVKAVGGVPKICRMITELLLCHEK